MELRIQCLALVGPLERFSHGAIVIFDKGQHFAFQVLDRSEVTTFDDFSNQDAEPDFDLVHPGSMFGRVMKDNPVGWVTQKSSPRSLGLQDPRFAFHTQIDCHV